MIRNLTAHASVKTNVIDIARHRPAVAAGPPEGTAVRSAGMAHLRSPSGVALGPGGSASVTVPAWMLSSLIVAATVDGTTGLLTNSAWRARAADCLTRAGNSGADNPLATWGLLVVDLDGFGALNERYGHPAVDHVLARVGPALRDAAGPQAVAGRFGGDEFVVLVPARTDATLRHIAEGVRLAIAALVVDVDSPQAPTGRVQIAGVTASIGAVRQRLTPAGTAAPRTAPSPIEAASTAIRRDAAHNAADPLTVALWAADTAMYRAKRAGGNTARMTTQPLL